MKTALIVDFDTRRVLFQKIVESLRLLHAQEDWDLNWGEPFLAVTRDRRIWVRIFYEETLPVSAEKIKHEIERLKPHLPAEGELSLCVPQSWGLNVESLPEEVISSARFWSYSNLENNTVFSNEWVRAQAAQPALKTGFMAPSVIAAELDFRLSSDEVRALAEMGLELKRLQRKQIS